MNMTHELEQDSGQSMKNHEAAIAGIKACKATIWKTQAQLSEMSGVAQPQISRLLNKNGTIGFDRACDLLDAVGAWIVFPGTKLSALSQAQSIDPLAVKVQEIAKTLRDSGVRDFEVLSAVRSMLDAEIEKARQSTYMLSETASPFSTAAEPKEEFGKK